ncbi:MAG TPA: glycine betaine ABC transporter substrate-binding protein, partial [Nocardioides sp.]|nr:glycine betaine ABC transporter substrate-binding protein [Nocardioides sp.]
MTWTLSRRLTALAVAPLLLLGGCAGEDALDGGDGGEGGQGEVVIGGQNYTEMQIMSEVYKQVLENAGYDVKVQLVESRAVYAPEMQRGNIDLSADYLASMTNYLNAEENGADAPLAATPDVEETLAKLRELA